MVRISEADAKIIERMQESGYKTSEIAKIVKTSARSVQRYIQFHEPDEIGAPWLPYKKPASLHLIKRQEKSERRKRLIKQIIEKDNTLTQEQINDQLPPEMRVNRRTICQAIKELKFVRRRLRLVPLERVSSRRAAAERVLSSINLSQDKA